MDFSLSDILIAVLSIVVTGFGFIIHEQQKKIKINKNKLSDKKYALYHEVYSLLFDIIKEQKDLKNKNNKDLGTRIIDIKKDMLIYAPDEINKKFIEWNRYVANNDKDIKHINIYLDLFVLMRKDMGHPKTEINRDDIWKLIMTTDAEINKMKELLK